MPASLVHLGPGSALPTWLTELDGLLFDQAWGALDDHEHLWAAPPLGYARWHVPPNLGEAELLRIGVAETARGKGLGRLLLRESLHALRTAHVIECRLEVRISNAPARRLYESDGWRLRGIRKGYYRNGEDAALYQLSLDSWADER